MLCPFARKALTVTCRSIPTGLNASCLLYTAAWEGMAYQIAPARDQESKPGREYPYTMKPFRLESFSVQLFFPNRKGQSIALPFIR